jgi:hypothetical protein
MALHQTGRIGHHPNKGAKLQAHLFRNPSRPQTLKKEEVSVPPTEAVSLALAFLKISLKLLGVTLSHALPVPAPAPVTVSLSHTPPPLRILLAVAREAKVQTVQETAQECGEGFSIFSARPA